MAKVINSRQVKVKRVIDEMCKIISKSFNKFVFSPDLITDDDSNFVGPKLPTKD